MEANSSNKFLGRRYLNEGSTPSEFVWWTYKEGLERINNFACGLQQIFGGLEEKSELPAEAKETTEETKSETKEEKKSEKKSH